VHFDVVEVSGTNQYKVRPAESVSTAVPLIAVVDSAPAAEASAAPDAAELPLPVAADPPELPHAVTASAIAARPAAPHIFRIQIS
jgi:hypothetical protein